MRYTKLETDTTKKCAAYEFEYRGILCKVTSQHIRYNQFRWHAKPYNRIDRVTHSVGDTRKSAVEGLCRNIDLALERAGV